MLNKKAQEGVEFLMTYGWAILVVLACIGALAYFGVLNPERFMPEKCILPSGMACTDFVVVNSRLDENVLTTVRLKIYHENYIINELQLRDGLRKYRCELVLSSEISSLFDCEVPFADLKFKSDIVIDYRRSDSIGGNRTKTGELIVRI